MCLSLEDPSTGSFLPSTCTHLFSFERAVPYVPEEKELGKEMKEVKETKEANAVKEVKEVLVDVGGELLSVLEDTKDYAMDQGAQGEGRGGVGGLHNLPILCIGMATFMAVK